VEDLGVGVDKVYFLVAVVEVDEVGGEVYVDLDVEVWEEEGT